MSLKQLRDQRIQEQKSHFTSARDIIEDDLDQNLDKSRENIPQDRKIQKLVGEKAVKDYYNHYKSLEKVKQQNITYGVEDSTFTQLLCHIQERNLYPSKLGIVKARGQERRMTLQNFNFGDKYVECLSQGLAKLNYNCFDFRRNRITDKGASAILQKLNTNIKVLDLSSNRIGKQGCEYLSSFLSTEQCRINKLRINSNYLDDINGGILLKGLAQNGSVKELDLSNNQLTRKSADLVVNVIHNNDALREVYLNWNQFNGEGGGKIFNELIENRSIKVLDLSWNSLGVGSGSRMSQNSTEGLCQMLIHNKDIVHLDLSNNNFSLRESAEVSSALSGNQTIYGFHFQGNYGYVDSQGHLKVDPSSRRSQKKEIINHRIQGVKRNKLIHREKGSILKDACWLCEGWVQQDFSWVYPRSGKAHLHPSFLCLDYQKWQGVYLGPFNKSANGYESKRMVPPGQIYFMYVFDGEHQINNILPKQSSRQFQPLKISYSDKTEITKLPQLNSVMHEIDENVINKKYEVQIDILPRMNDFIYIRPVEAKKKIEWDLKKSIFKDFTIDSDELLRKCFEFDFKCSKIPKFIKNEEDLLATKEVMHSHYRAYKNCYKFYASMNPIQDIWCLQNLDYCNFVDQAGIIDQVVIRQQEADLKFVATNANIDQKGPKNPERGLVRFQFYESLVRLAEEKYLKSKVVSTYQEAVIRILDEHCLPEFRKYNQQQFRDTRYWNQKCEQAILHYRKYIDNIYNKNSQKKVNPGQKKFMCLEESVDICKQAELFFNTTIQETDIFQSYNLSIMTQIDELTSARIFQMYQLEFYEFLARTAEKANLAPIDYPEMSEQDSQQQPLHIKYESLVHLFVQKCCDDSFKDNNPLPKQSIFLDQPPFAGTETLEEEETEENKNGSKIYQAYKKANNVLFISK